MTHDDIIRWAREAGFNIEQGFLLRVTGIDEDLARFAKLVAAAEREACAKVCEAYDSADPLNVSGECAERIRLRGRR